MHRFFVPPESIASDVAAIPQPQARQIARVLRLAPGDEIVVLDDTGVEYEVVLTEVDAKGVFGKVVDQRPTLGEPRRRIVLYQALLKSDRFELVLQKCTELGLSAFAPFVSDRTVVRESARGRVDRWRRIVTEAAEQSRRGRIPTILDPVTLQEAVEGPSGIAIMPWEDERDGGLRTTINQALAEDDGAPDLAIIVGPEGGFAEDEVGFAREHGVRVVSLGRRILRAETAAITAVSAVLYELGELGG